MILIYIILILLVALVSIIYINDSNNYKQDNNDLTIPTTNTSNKTTTKQTTFEETKNEEIVNIIDKYNEFNNVLVNVNIKIPLTDGFIPQGITYYNDYLLIIGYFENGKNSKCYILDLSGEVVNEVELDTNSHVGAIAYDNINDLFWIPDNDGILNAYNASEFIYANNVNCIYKIDYVSEGLDDYIYLNKKNIAFVSIDENYIYIGNFYKTKKSLVKKYLIKNEDTIKLEYINQFLVPPRTQGIDFIDYNNEKYMLFSNSFNRRTTSYLEIYKYDESITDYSSLFIKKIEMPTMSEQVVTHDRYAFIIFESGAKKYYNALDKINYVCILDVNQLLN